MDADEFETSVPPADTTGERLIADRLDALEAERVMQRALELEAKSLDTPHMITTDQLQRIASEIGVDPSFVHQALGEIRLAPKERSRFVTWVMPDDLLETATVTGLPRDDVDQSITKWMTQHEGLTQGGLLADGVEWHVDRRWLARALSSSLSGGNRISRVAGSDVSHRVHSVGEHEHVVAMQSEGRGPVFLARAVMALGLAVSSLMLLGATVSGDFFIGLPVFVAINAAMTALGVAGARWWGRGIRGALRRSLVGLVGAAKPRRKGWLSRRKHR